MKKLSEPILAGITLIMLGVIIGTLNVDMSDMTSMTLSGIFGAALFGYILFVYQEKPADEREEQISQVAGKISYIVGASVLSIGIIVQSLNHELSIWLPVALSSMVLAKLLVLVMHNR